MKAIRKKFSLSYPDLAMFASNLVVSMNRDSVEFAARGVEAAAITAFHDLGNSFEVFPSDIFYVGAIEIEVDAKNAARETVTKKIQYISGFFEQQWGLDSGQYRQLRISKLTVSSDNDFLVAARSVVDTATLYLTDLTPIGLTQIDIDELETEAQTFEDKLNAVADKRMLRDDKARERAILANELYDYTAKYCAIGKLIWENVNEAKYNDYVIYKTSHGGLSKVGSVSLVEEPEHPDSITVHWGLVPAATYYEIQVSVVAIGDPSGDYSLAGTPANPPFLQPKPVGQTRNWFRIRAMNDTETGYWSDEAYIDIDNPAS